MVCVAQTLGLPTSFSSRNEGGLVDPAVMETKLVLHADPQLSLFSIYAIACLLYRVLLLKPSVPRALLFFSRLSRTHPREPGNLHHPFPAQPLTADQQVGVEGSKDASNSLQVRLTLCSCSNLPGCKVSPSLITCHEPAFQGLLLGNPTLTPSQ